MSTIIKKISYSILANVFSVIISIMMILILPKSMSLEDYGMWQLFLFYFSYVGFFHFGWIDGIYLRFGGKFFEQLDRDVFSSQFFLFNLFIMSESIIINSFAENYLMDTSNRMVISCVIIAGFFYNILAFVNFILQFTGKIKEYAMNTVLERILTFIFVFLLLLTNITSYISFMYVKIITCCVAAIYAVFKTRALLISGCILLKEAFKEALINISVGSKLMMSNIASLLVLGIIRFGISQGWDIITFGKLSLTLQISNFLMIFINAISIVMFPFLKRIDTAKLSNIYIWLRRGLSYSLLGLLLTYYPISYLLELWLPKYKDSLMFMSYLLPFCIFESKMQLIINTYLKTLRQELLMLKINIASIFTALITTYVTVVVCHNLKYVVLGIVLNFAFRSIVAEYYLESLLGIRIDNEKIGEILLVVIFIFINLFAVEYSMLYYTLAYLIYMYINQNNIKLLYINIRNGYLK